MKHKVDYTKSITTLLTGLKRKFPHTELSVHLSGALDEYDGKFWGLSDKELFNALDKYAEGRAIEDSPEELEKIFQDAMNLNNESYNEEDEYED